MRRLNLDQLKEGQPGISKSAGNFLSEAGAFCLMKNGHQKGVELKVNGDEMARLGIK